MAKHYSFPAEIEDNYLSRISIASSSSMRRSRLLSLGGFVILIIVGVILQLMNLNAFIIAYVIAS